MYPLKELWLSHSSRSSFQSCPRKLEFAKFFEMRKQDVAFDADVGTALHMAYQKWFMTGSMEDAVLELLIHYPTELFHTKAASNQKCIEACYAALVALTESSEVGKTELATVKCLDGETRPAIEVPFEIEILNFSLSDTENVPVYYIGWIDKILYSWAEREYCVTDIKTHGNRTYDLGPKYLYDEQCVPAAIVLQEILGKPLEKFAVKYMSVYIDVASPRVDIYQFTKLEQDVHDWAMGLRDDLLAIKSYYNQEWFPRRTNGNACFAFNRPCTYMDLCGSRDIDYLNNVMQSMKQEKEEQEEEDAEEGISSFLDLPARKLTKRPDEWKPWVKIKLDFGGM